MYWCRIGSDFGSQFGFFFRVSLVVWSYGPSRMYGPEATHSASYFAPESLAFGTGVVVGMAATYGSSGWAFAKANLMVLSSGVVTPGASPASGPLYLRSGSSAFCRYCGPCSP